jgi:hypothetical protein
MPKKRFSAEQIVTLLRQIEVSMAQGKPTPVACRDAGMSLMDQRGQRCILAAMVCSLLTQLGRWPQSDDPERSAFACVKN